MRAWHEFFAVCGLAVGCAPSAAPAAARAEPTPAPRASAAPEPAKPMPSAASSADVVTEPAPLPLPPAPPGTDPEQALFAASLCAAAYSGKDVGCRSHPPFERPEQKPDGKFVEHQGDPLLFCGIDRIFKGAFSRPGAKQAIVSFAQCKEGENAVWDSGFPGSAVLAEEVDGRWKAVGYEPDVNIAGCLQDRRPDGREVLLCRSGLGAPPSGEVTYFFVLDFAEGAAGKPNAHSFAKLFGDIPLCFAVDGGLPSGLVSLDVIGMKLANVNHDGIDDLVVKVKRGRAAPSRALDAKVRAACKPDQGMLNVSAFVPTPKTTTLEFLSDGDRFRPSPATKKLLDAWVKEGPEEFNGLLGVGPPMFE